MGKILFEPQINLVLYYRTFFPAILVQLFQLIFTSESKFYFSGLIRTIPISYHKDEKTVIINQSFNCRISPTYENKSYGTFIDPNPLKSTGLPVPSYILAIAYRYRKSEDLNSPEIPIAENALFCQLYPISIFEQDIKRIQKVEEAKHILEGTIFNKDLEKITSELKNAYVFFEQESYSQTKTSCRKVIEKLKSLITCRVPQLMSVLLTEFLSA
jgi:hypothetical protein